MRIFDPAGKLWANLDKVCEWQKQPWAMWPTTVEIAPTNRCNHNCSHCLFASTRGTEELPDEILDKLLNDFKRIGVKSIIWTGGGEPLLYKDLESYDQFVDAYGWWQHFWWKTKNMGIRQGLYTNLSKYDSVMWDHMLDTQDWIRISVDAATAETYENIRGVDDFERVCENIKVLVQRRNYLKAKCTIGVGMVVTSQNMHEAHDFCQLFNEYEVDYIQLKPSINKPDLQGFEDYFEARRLMNLCSAFPKVDTTDYKWRAAFGEKDYEYCKGHAFTTFVGADAKVYMCSTRQGQSRTELGDLRNQSFREIWSGQRRKQVYEDLKLLEGCPTACRCHELNKQLEAIGKTELQHTEFL